MPNNLPKKKFHFFLKWTIVIDRYIKTSYDINAHFQNNINPITCVKLVSSVDYMLAAGNSEGVVAIYQIPRTAENSSIVDHKDSGNSKMQVSRLMHINA